MSVSNPRTSRWPRSTKPVAFGRACQPSLVPMVAASPSKPCFFLLLGQSGELGAERMIGREECLLAMENRRISAGGVIEAVNLAGAERELGASTQGRVRVCVELGINEV
jgi:hypothetical protein